MITTLATLIMVYGDMTRITLIQSRMQLGRFFLVQQVMYGGDFRNSK